MSVTGLDWQTVQFSFTSGLNTKAHGQALDPPGLSSCKNVEFDEVGGLRLRKPYASIGANIYPSGTIADARKLVVVGDELLLFTKDTLYSWSETLTAWVSRGEHLAVATTETAVFGNTSDQVFADRAQLSGTIVYVWTEVTTASTTAYLAARDATTGATVIVPTSFGAGNSRPRAVALATKIIVAWLDAGVGVVCTAIDPAAPTFTTAGATLLTTEETIFDIVKDPNADQAVFVIPWVTRFKYDIGKVTSALAVTTSTKIEVCDGVIALSCSPNGLVVVVRDVFATGDILADTITLSTLADVSMAVFIGNTGTAGVYPCSQITAAHRSTTNGGAYRCYAFWYVRSGTGASIQSNWIDTIGGLGYEVDSFALSEAIASRAFSYDGAVYLWTVFGEATNAGGVGTASLQLGIRGQFLNSYYLRRDDAHLASKASGPTAGGFAYYTGHLPGVALVSGTTVFAWAALRRQIIELGGTDQSSYAARDPLDVGFTFDSDDARRVVQMGATAYISGGLLLQYDGRALTEVGFEQFPWSISTSVTAGAGTAAAGAYNYKSTLRWDNARGEVDRSTTAIGVQVTIAASDQVNVSVYSLNTTRKTGVSVEVWRTVKDAPPDAPFYLVTSRDPSATGDNGYIDRGTGLGDALTGDVFTDAIATTKEQSPENAGTLPRVTPPGASILAVSDVRMFLAGIPGDPYAVVYSLLRNEGEVAGFNGALRFTVPANTGPITALALQAETLVVFTASAVYVVPGDGFDNTGGGSNYGPPRTVSTDVGALSHDTIAVTPAGLVFFSRKGWYRLSQGWDLEYIGAKVEDFNSDTWVAAQVVESQHQVRFLSSSRMLVWDYLIGEWSEWTQASGKDLAMWRTYPMLLDSAPKKEQTTFSAVDYAMVVVTGWLKPAQMQGMARLRRMMVLGEYKADHAQALEVGFDYATTYTDAVSMGFQSLTVGNPTQFRHGPSRQRIEAVRAKITIITAGRSGGGEIPASPTYPAADAVALTGLAFEVGLRRGLYARLPAAQKQ